jgi:hypothetical protein
MIQPYTFEYVNVKSELVERLKVELPKFGLIGKRAVIVIPSDPSEPGELPCITVNRVDDSESEQSIADVSGEPQYDPETKIYSTYTGTFFSEGVEIRVWHTNADERDRVYHIVKGVLFAIRPDLVEKGLLNLTLRGGMDEQDATMQFAPVVLYWSTITMTYLNPLDVEYTETVDSIQKIYDLKNIQE